MQVNKLRDSQIRPVLLRELESRFCDPEHDLILQEFGCNAARVDVAVVNGAFHGFEIKSDRDSLERLGGQIAEYGKIFDYVTLVSGKRLLRSARNKVPTWWGIRVAVDYGDSVRIRELRKPKKNLNLDPYSLAEMLWKREIIQCLRRAGNTHISARQPVDELRSEITRILPIEMLAAEVRAAITRGEALDLSSFEFEVVVRTPLSPLSTAAAMPRTYNGCCL